MTNRRDVLKMFGGVLVTAGATTLLGGRALALIPSPETPIPALSAAEQQLTPLLCTSKGRQKLAASLGSSMRRRADYIGVARRGMRRIVAPDGEQVVLKNPNRDTIYYVVKDGGAIHRTTDAEFELPTFEIVSTPMLPAVTAMNRPDLVARALNLARAEIVALEDEYLFSLIRTAKPLHPTVKATLFGRLGVEHFDYLTKDVWGGRPALPEMHVVSPETYAGFVLKGGAMSEYFHPSCQRRELKTGIMGETFTKSNDGSTHCTKLVQKRMPEGDYGCMFTLATERGKDTDYADVVMGQRIGLSVMSNDREDLDQLGFSIFENVGFAVNENDVALSMQADIAKQMVARYRRT